MATCTQDPTRADPARRLTVPHMSEVDVVFRKFDGRLHRRANEQYLGEDEWGTWLGVPVGTQVHYVSAGITRADEHRSVRLVPHDGWYTPLFFAPTRSLEMYCDITAPPTWTGRGQVTMVDLDLDVIRTHQGRIELLDEDEFAAHQVSYGYPPETIRQATEAARQILAACRARTEPFGAHYLSWLDQV
jgi:protein associated with RNAse G/E